MFTVDTNILLYAANADSPLHRRARKLLEAWRQGTELWYCGWTTVYEFARVATHPKVFRRPWQFAHAWQFCQALLDSPAVRLMVEGSDHADVVADLAKGLPSLSGNLVHDLHTVALMKEQGLTTIYTRDSAFQQFSGIRVLDPLS